MPPTTLINSLESVRRKVKLLGMAYGVGIALAVAVAGLLVATLLDYLLNLPPVPRLMSLLLALGGDRACAVVVRDRPAISACQHRATSPDAGTPHFHNLMIDCAAR